MKISARSKNWAVAIGVTIASMVASVFLCRYISLRAGAIELEIPDPPGSEVTTTIYRDWSLLGGYFVWDRHYRISVGTFESVDAVEQYFDDWLAENDWVTGGMESILTCTTPKLTREEIERSLATIYGKLPRFPETEHVCLVIEPTPEGGFYEVRLMTLNPTPLNNLND
jgi:hypothetical protein